MDFAAIQAIMTPVVIVITGAFKAYGVNSKLLPFIAILIGILGGFGLTLTLEGAFYGLTAAGMAMGLYSAGKTLAQ